MAIKHWPESERPREKLLSRGAAQLNDSELLAIFLRVGTQGKTAIDLARDLLQHFGSLHHLLSASEQEFCRRPGMGSAKYCQLQASLEMSKRFYAGTIRERDLLDSPDATRQFLKSALIHKSHEVFACLFLNSQHQVLCFEELFQGTIDAASVYPREVVQKVLATGAVAVIFCHNHPSGSLQPSQADIQITERLCQALALIDVRVLDHMIVAGDQVCSMAELGLL